jgi:molybdenum cofactor cytidylyltransferase
MRSASLDAVAGVVLAAGRSVRMGRPKAFLPLGAGETFLSRVLFTLDAAGAAPLIVVGTAEWPADPAGVSPHGARLVFNPAPDRGQVSSLQCGLAAVPPAISAVLFTLVDVPLVTVVTVRTLIDVMRGTDADVVRPERSGRHGHPVLVARTVVEDLLAADVSETARAVLGRYAGSTVDVSVQDEGAFLDIDTPEQYERLARTLREAPGLGPG